ncbi:MAG TPA: GAF domain-containing protein, partial [Gemmatimonadales bacterium]|nr:GAF domain-containing protein [Gemmatimonadales bacterium]
MTQVTPPPRLETPPEEAFDRLTRLAARLLGAPVALVSVIGDDRVLLESAVGMPEPWASHRSMPLAYSFCRHVVASGEPLVVEDARRHPLVRSNPAIRELSWISYAGVPLLTGEGRPAGTLCVIDALPRLWSPRDVALLQDLAASVVTEMALRSHWPRDDGAPPPAARPPAAQPVRDPAAQVFEISALPMGLVDDDGRWLRVNHALAELLGSTPGALAGSPAEAATHPADRSADREAIRLLLAGECASYTAEKRLLREGDEPAWVLATVTALPPEPGVRPRYLVAFEDIGDRKRAEQDLRAREERYRLAAAAGQDAVWDWDLLTDRIVWEELDGGALGYQAPTPGGGTAAWWYERLHADDRERIVSGIHAAIACGATEWSGDYRFRAADGRYVQVRDRAAIVRDEAGDAVRMVGAVTDVTGETRAELLAHGQSRLLEQIAVGLDLDPLLERVVRFTEAHGSDLLAAVMVLDPETRTLRLAAGPSLPAGVRVALASVPVREGASLSAAAAARRERVVVTDLAGDPTAAAWGAPLLAEGLLAAWAVPLFAADGALVGTLEVHYPDPRAPDDGDLRVVEVASHLAEIAIARGRHEEALARSNRLLQQVLDTLPIGVWVLDGDGLIRFANPTGRAVWGGARLFGVGDLGEIRGWRAATGEPIAPDEWPAARALRLGEAALPEAVHVEAHDGVHRTFLTSAVPLRGPDGGITGAIALYQDVTEQHAREEALSRSEEQLRQAQK